MDTSIFHEDEDSIDSDVTYMSDEPIEEVESAEESLSSKVEIRETADGKMNSTGNGDKTQKYVPFPAAKRRKRLSESKSALASAHIATEKTKKKLLGMRRKHGLFHLEDPTELVALKASIQEQIDLMDKKIPNDDGDYAFGVEYLRQNYDRLIRSCRNYEAFLNAQPKLFLRDRTMKKMIKQIIDQSEAEKDAFAIIRDEYISGLRYDGEKWRDVLYVIRAERLDAKDLKSEGAGTSNIKVLTNPDGSKSYIKPEERSAEKGTISEYLSMYANTGDQTIQEYFRSVMADKNFEQIEANLSETLDSIGRPSELEISFAIRKKANSETKRVMKGHLYSFLEFAFKKKNELGVSRGAGINAGSVISSRNVSTTRVADRLGVGDIVARSETVIVKQKDGSFVRANSMEGITGENVMQMGKLINMLKKEWSNRRLRITGKAATQLFELQVLDLICGQIDRHMGNYMAIFRFEPDSQPTSPDSGELIIEGIKGIDNDLAFGIQGDSFTYFGSQHTRPIKQMGRDKICIYFISKKFYDRIMTPGMEQFLQLDQMDLRTPEEIRTLVERFLYIKKQISDFVASGKMTVIEDESDYETRYAEKYEEISSAEDNGPFAFISYVSKILYHSRKRT